MSFGSGSFHEVIQEQIQWISSMQPLLCVRCLGFAYLFFFAASCHHDVSKSGVGERPKTGDSHLQADPDGNVVLHVGNQSSSRPLIDIEVFVDNSLAVRAEFDARKTNRHHSYQFQVPSGEHVIRVSSKKGQADLEKSFLIDGHHWIVVDYFYSPGGKKGILIDPSFSFRISDEPIYFQ